MTEQLERLMESAEARQIARDAELGPQSADPVLITEAEVVFSTAAAVALRPTTGWRTRPNQVAIVVRTFVASLTYDRPKPRPRPARLWYLEDSRMQREMERL